MTNTMSPFNFELGAVDARFVAVVQEIVAQAPTVRFEAGTYEGIDDSGDGIVRLDSADPAEAEAMHCPIVGPQPNYGARVLVAFGTDMNAYIIGEVMLPAQIGQLKPRVLLDSPNGQISFYDAQGTLVGRLSADRWFSGVEADGPRTQIDPLGGFRVFDTTGRLTVLLDAQGLQVKDPDPTVGIVHASIGHHGSVFTAQDGKQIHIVPSQDGAVVVPKWAGTPAGPSPGANVVTPGIAEVFGPNDFELRYGVVMSDIGLASTFTPPAGYTEVFDVSAAGGDMTVAASCVSRQPHTVTAARNIVCSQAGHDFHNGHTILVKANPTGPAPSVRSFEEDFTTHFTETHDITLPKPAGVVAGDLLVAFVSLGNKGGHIPVSWSVPDGWIFLGAVFRDTGATLTLASGVWYKQATASEPSTYSVTVRVAGAPSSQKRYHSAVVAIQNPATLEGGSDIRFEPQSALRVYKTAAQAFPGISVPMQVTWNQFSYDTGNNWRTSPFSHYRVPASGPYKMGFQLQTNGIDTAGDFFRANISRSIGGVFFDVICGTGDVATPGGRTKLWCHDVAYLNEGDQLTVDAVQGGGIVRALDGQGSAIDYWYIKRDIST